MLSLSKHRYDPVVYPFRKIVQDMFQFPISLEAIHQFAETNPQLTFESDTKSIWQRTFYNSPLYSTFRDAYYAFVTNEIFKQFPDESSLVVQMDPCFRVCAPDNTALGLRTGDSEEQIGLHCDAEYNHPAEEVNFLVGITDLWESNSVYIESEPHKGDFTPMSLRFSEYALFWGNRCRHFNRKNTTGFSRVSIDFRVIPFSKYNPDYELRSVHGNRKFVIGDYFIRIDRPTVI